MSYNRRIRRYIVSRISKKYPLFRQLAPETFAMLWHDEMVEWEKEIRRKYGTVYRYKKNTNPLFYEAHLAAYRDYYHSHADVARRRSREYGHTHPEWANKKSREQWQRIKADPAMHARYSAARTARVAGKRMLRARKKNILYRYRDRGWRLVSRETDASTF